MTREITDHDIEMSDKMQYWMARDDNGVWYLKEDAPDDVKKYYDKLGEVYKGFI